MSMKMKHNLGDMTPVLGGAALPADIDSMLPSDDSGYPDDDLGRIAYWLLTLHKDKLRLKFRKSDILAMDDSTKSALIADINEALGIDTDFGDIL
jgi:hypothetical protein